MLTIQLNSESTQLLFNWGVQVDASYEVQEQSSTYDNSLNLLTVTLLATEVSDDGSWFHYNFTENVTNLEGHIQIKVELVNKEKDRKVITHQSDGIRIERPSSGCN
ncbi:MAG: hypothetical protein AAGA77_23625 [Bacteroidota bacterium]